MPNNFHLTIAGAAYVSKSGNDSTGDGSKDTPYKTIQKGVDSAGSVVIGAGKYEEVIFTNFGRQLYADGFVEMDGSSFGTGGFLYTSSGSPTSKMVGPFFIHDYVEGVGRNINVTFQKGTTVTTAAGPIFKDIADWQFNTNIFSNWKWSDCLFINVQGIDDSNGPSLAVASKITKCTFIGCHLDVRSINQFIDNIVDGGSIWFNDNFITDNNVIRNVTEIRQYGPYNIQKVDSPYANLAAYQASVNTGVFNDNSLDVDPLYNAVTADDYTLSGASPILTAGRNGQQIGKHLEARSFDGLVSEFTTGGGATHTNLTVAGNGDITLTSPTINGELESAVIDLGVLANPVGIVWLNALQSYPSDVLDSDNTDANPNRLTYELRWSNVSLAAVSAEVYQHYQWNHAVTEDSVGVANGETTFDPTTATQVVARWVQIKITFAQDGVEA